MFLAQLYRSIKKANFTPVRPRDFALTIWLVLTRYRGFATRTETMYYDHVFDIILIGPMSMVLYASGSTPWEGKALRLAIYFARNSRVFIDVGAGIGMYSLRIAKVMQNGTVIACEPDPRSYYYLLKNIRYNKLYNVKPLRVALSNKTGRVRLLMFERPGWSSITTLHKARVIGEVEVETTTLDRLVEDLKLRRVDLVKIDVEGAEINVLEGSTYTLSTYKPNMLIEVHGLDKLGRVKEILQSHGYRIREVARGYTEEEYVTVYILGVSAR
jgi:FkbM family methyltransferase